MWCSLKNHAWCTMVDPINNINLWNLAKVKSVKILKSPDVAHIVINTFRTPTPKSIEWPKPFSNSLPLNMVDELVMIIAIAKTHCFCLSMFANVSYIISSSLEDKELELIDREILELFPIELEAWLEDAMISKWKNPLTWVRNEKENKWVQGACANIIPTHKTKLMGFKAKIMNYFFAQGWRLRFWIAILVWGLIMSEDKDYMFWLWY